MIIDRRTQSSDGCLKYQSPSGVRSAQAIGHLTKLSKSCVRFRPFERNFCIVSLLHTPFLVIFFVSIVTEQSSKRIFAYGLHITFHSIHILFIFVCLSFFIFVVLFLVRESFYAEQTQYTCSRLGSVFLFFCSSSIAMTFELALE